MRRMAKKEDGTIVELKDVADGEQVVLVRQRTTPDGADEYVEVRTVRRGKSVHKNPDRVHASRSLTPEQLEGRIAKWREKHPHKSERQLRHQADFVKADRAARKKHKKHD